MINTKVRLSQFLVSNIDLTAIVGDRIHHQVDDEESNKREDKLPLITYYRIGGSLPNRSTKRIDRFQITSRANTSSQADQIIEIVIRDIVGMLDDTIKNAFVIGAPVDLYDPMVKAKGAAITVDLILSDR